MYRSWEALTAVFDYIAIRHKSTTENDQKSVTGSADTLSTDD
jgi:hypothetical protein